MFVLVHHTISNPRAFWALSESAGDLPEGLTLHQTLSAKDGTLATCLWEAESVDAVRSFLEPATDGMAKNEYREAENREGVVFPSQFMSGTRAVAT
jgi:hypothetical protein